MKLIFYAYTTLQHHNTYTAVETDLLTTNSVYVYRGKSAHAKKPKQHKGRWIVKKGKIYWEKKKETEIQQKIIVTIKHFSGGS